jgi:hypothetical protein
MLGAVNHNMGRSWPDNSFVHSACLHTAGVFLYTAVLEVMLSLSADSFAYFDYYVECPSQHQGLDYCCCGRWRDCVAVWLSQAFTTTHTSNYTAAYVLLVLSTDKGGIALSAIITYYDL